MSFKNEDDDCKHYRRNKKIQFIEEIKYILTVNWNTVSDRDLSMGSKSTVKWAAMPSTLTHWKQLMRYQCQLALWQNLTYLTQRDENNDQNCWGHRINCWGHRINQVLSTLWGTGKVRFISKSEQTEVI